MLTVHALAVSLRFGVDAAVLPLVPLTILGAQLASRRWAWGLVSGTVAGLVTALHFSTIPYALPAFVFILIATKGQHRWLAAGAHLLGVALVLWSLSLVFPVSTLEGFKTAIANGIAPGYQGDGVVGSFDTAANVIAQGLPTALDRGVAQMMVQIRPSWLPWHLTLVLPWLGVLGVGLGGSAPHNTTGWFKRLLARTDLPLGIALLLCLAPVPVLAAAQAPLRYADNLLPVAALLLVRGGVSLLIMAGGGVLAVLPRGPVWAPFHRIRARWVAAAAAVPIIASAIRDAAPARAPLLPTIEELGYWQLGQVLAETFPPGSGVASPIREALVPGRLDYCPQRICPIDPQEAAYWECLGIMVKECEGTAPIGYVITDADLYDPNARARRDMDDWVAAKWEPLAVIDETGFFASVYTIDRALIPALPKEDRPPNDPGAPRGPDIPGMTDDPGIGPPDGGPVGPPNAGGSGPPG